ncbi:MAG TPA: MarR family transcriptional regulator [Anaerolineaceae bacterium]|nr:MarR family transcriptional regulator [Anaerolineaceae bacterium]
MEAEQADSPGDSKPLLEITPELSRFIENMGLHYESYGVPRIGGRILGLLLIAQEPLTPEQIAETLMVSRSSVSTNLRMVLMAGLVEKVTRPGDRCDYFVFSPEAWERSLQIRMGDILELRDVANETLSALEGDHPVRRRLQEMTTWVDLVEQVVNQVSERWQPQSSLPA